MKDIDKTDNYHSHHHSHSHISGKNLKITVFLNILISLAQILGGIISGSMSLISDAAHNFSDVLSLILSYFTNKLSHREKNKTYTFGYKRAEILSALFNSLTLILIALLIITEAVKRVSEQTEIKADIVIYFALASIFINTLSVLLLHNDSKENINIKSSYLHLLSDVMTSVAVMIGGLVLKYTNFYLIDVILSILIAVYLVYSSYGIVKEAIFILMNRVPEYIDLRKLKDEIVKNDKVDDLFNIRLWSLNEKEVYFEAEIFLNEDLSISEFEAFIEDIGFIFKKHKIKNFYLMPKVKNIDT